MVMRADVTCDSVQGAKTVNDDRVVHCVTDDNHLYVVLADGLGGHTAGFVAAEILTTEILKSVQSGGFSNNHDLERMAANANCCINKAQAASVNLSGMRSTLVVLHVDLNNATAQWAHCGDSRLYHIRNGNILHFTKDHSVAQMLVSDGEIERKDIPFHPERNQLTRSMGGNERESQVRVKQDAIAVVEGDQFLLCSDGFWELLSELEIAESTANSKNQMDKSNRWLDSLMNIAESRFGADADDCSICCVGINEAC